MRKAFVIFKTNKFKLFLVIIACFLSLIFGYAINCLLKFTCFNRGVAFDLFAIITGAIVIFFIGFLSLNDKKWVGQKAWIPVALIIAAGAVAFALVELDLDKGGLLVEKVSICHCEICLNQKIQNEIKCLCDFKNPNDNTGCESMPNNWMNYYMEAKAEIAKKPYDLLNLCCAQTTNQFLKELNQIKCFILTEIDSCTSNDQLKEKIVRLVLLDNLALQAFSQTIGQGQVSCSCPKGKPESEP